MQTVVTRERPDSADAVELIAELDAQLTPLYSPGNRHGYSVEKLLAEQVAFFVLRVDGVPAGCGGVQLFGSDYAELKRMYVRPQYRGSGLGRLLVDHLADHARSHGIALLRLETGIHQATAIRLYERLGFQRVPPFGAYEQGPYNPFFEKRIAFCARE
jgi:GNAT superfamily N-acetyltransferase